MESNAKERENPGDDGVQSGCNLHGILVTEGELHVREVQNAYEDEEDESYPVAHLHFETKNVFEIDGGHTGYPDPVEGAYFVNWRHHAPRRKHGNRNSHLQVDDTD